jgi:SAM-dependent methyltransferase
MSDESSPDFLGALDARARGQLRAEGWPEAPLSAEALERAADEMVRRQRALRAALAEGLVERAADALDRRMATDASERMDDPAYPEARKLRQVKLLHLQNRVVGTYRACARALAPTIAEAAARRADGRARVLELASGYGELAMGLAQQAEAAALPATIVGSDIVAGYVREAAARAKERGLPVEFKELDACQLGALAPGSIDVVLIAQSAHHFRAGQLARMIASAGALGASEFVCIDGRRGPAVLLGISLLAAVTLDDGHLHDAWVSGRRMFSGGELRTIAELAAPEASIRVTGAWPAYTILRVRFPSRGAAPVDARAAG